MKPKKPQTEYFGIGSRSKLSYIIDNLNPKTVFLVTGKKSFEQLNKKYHLIAFFGQKKIIKFCDFSTNPTINDIIRGIQLYKTSNPDVVVAIGGGSSIDIAKAINSLSVHDYDPLLYIKGELSIHKSGKPLIALPTTSGTGSESTQFSAITVGKTKYSISDKRLLPKFAVIDPELTFDLPSYITATTGLDGLTQAIESLWSNKSTSESRKYASQAISLFVKHLEKAVNSPSQVDREAVSKAAYLAGKAINISLTTACHAISYPFTACFGVVHGHAVALTLPLMIIFNSQVTKEDLQDNRGISYVKSMIKELLRLLNVNNAQEAADKINKLMKAIGIETKLSHLGIKTSKDIEIIINNGLSPSRVSNNPRILTKNNLRKMLQSII